MNPLTEELELHLSDELDFEDEAFNTELIATSRGRPGRSFVPEVIRPYVTEQVLVLERSRGQGRPRHGLARTARRAGAHFFNLYIQQVTLKGVYHADPHRGNVLLTPDGRLALLDFGLLGRLDDDTRRSLALLLLAIASNRADDVADQILWLSLTTIDADEPGFVHELRRSCRATTGARSPGSAPAKRSPTCSGSRSRTASAADVFALVGKTLSQAERSRGCSTRRSTPST